MPDTLPHLATVEDAIAFLNRHPAAGVWRDYDTCWVSAELDNGQAQLATLDRSTLQGLIAGDVVGNNYYAGHKAYRRVYPVVPERERATFVRRDRDPGTLLVEMMRELEARADAKRARAIARLAATGKAVTEYAAAREGGNADAPSPPQLEWLLAFDARDVRRFALEFEAALQRVVRDRGAVAEVDVVVEQWRKSAVVLNDERLSARLRRELPPVTACPNSGPAADSDER